MKRGWQWWIAWGTWGLTAALFAVGITIQEIAGDRALDTGSLVTHLGLLVAFLGFSTVGAAVAVRQPRNAVGWVFLAIGLFVAIALASGEYANYTFVVEPGSLPGGIVAGWFHLWTWLPGVMLVMFLPLLFPNGRVPGRRWRPVLWALVAVMVVFTATAWFFPGPMQAREAESMEPACSGSPSMAVSRTL